MDKNHRNREARLVEPPQEGPAPDQFTIDQHSSPGMNFFEPAVPEIPVRPHRQWPELYTLELSIIQEHLYELSTRCDDARTAFKAVLIDLETSTNFFLHPRPPLSHDRLTEYLHIYQATLAAGRAIFTPQEAYRNAILTLRLLVSDLQELLQPPGQGVQSDEMIDREDGIKEVLGELVSGVSQGRESASLATYLVCMRERLAIWGKEEQKLRAEAAGCVAALH